MIPESSHDITILHGCSRAIAEADHLDELADPQSRVEAIRVSAMSVDRSLEVQNRETELRLLAERNAGKSFSQMRLMDGDQISNVHDNRLKLSDLRITQNLSIRWQREANISDQQFAEHAKTSSVLSEERLLDCFD